MKKILQGLEEGPKANINLKSLKKSKWYQIVKRQSMMFYMDSSFKNSRPYKTLWLHN